MAPRAQNNTSVAYPLYGVDGFASGWFKFDDKYLRPEVLYGSWPPVTSVKLGGRSIQSDRAVPVKIKLLEPEEDQTFWCGKKQHCDRTNLGEFHRDFGDAEVAYSFSSPQTHIFFSGYSIHFEAFENLSFSSYNATVHVRPEHILGDNVFLGRDGLENAMNGIKPSPSPAIKDGYEEGRRPRLKALMEGTEMVQHDSGASTRDTLVASYLTALRTGEDPVIPSMASPQQMTRGYFPLYSCKIPVIREGLAGREALDYQYTAQHFNDCERDINLHEEFNIGIGITAKSAPVSVPPVFPPLRPYEIPEMIFSSSRTKGGIHPTQIVKMKKRRQMPPQILPAHPSSEFESRARPSIADQAYREMTATCCPSDLSESEFEEDLDVRQPTDVFYEESYEQYPPKHVKRRPQGKRGRPKKGGVVLTPISPLAPHQHHSHHPRYGHPYHDPHYNDPRYGHPYNDPRHGHPYNDPRYGHPYSEDPAQTSSNPWDGFVVDYRYPNDIPPWVNDNQLHATKNLTKLGSTYIQSPHLRPPSHTGVPPFASSYHSPMATLPPRQLTRGPLFDTRSIRHDQRQSSPTHSTVQRHYPTATSNHTHRVSLSPLREPTPTSSSPQRSWQRSSQRVAVV